MVQTLTGLKYQSTRWLSLVLSLAAITLSMTSASASEETAERAYLLSKQAYNLMEKNPQRAAELLWQSASLNPNDGNTQYNLGVSFSRLKRHQDACNAFRKAVDRSQLHHSFSIGETSHGTNTAGEDQATVYLFLNSGNSVDDTEFYDTCLHEIGHAIGLSHSSNPADVMYNASNTENGLTANDKARALELYRN